MYATRFRSLAIITFLSASLSVILTPIDGVGAEPAASNDWRRGDRFRSLATKSPDDEKPSITAGRTISNGFVTNRWIVDEGVGNTDSPDRSVSVCRSSCGENGCGCDANWTSAANSFASRGTLFQWSYRTSFSGGPDLNEPLVTDRPDFTEASSTVGLGVSQIEFGYTYVYDTAAEESVRTHSGGEPLLRHGIFANWLELRVALFPVSETTTTNGVQSTTRGIEDLYLGLKIGLTPQEGIFPEMALIPQMTVPTGSSALTNNEVLPGANWVYAWEINDFVTTAGSTQFNRSVDETTGDAYVLGAQSWTVGVSLTERVGAYAEWFVLFPIGADTDSVAHFANGGVTYLCNDDLQFDVRIGKGLNGAADDYFLGAGASIRFK